MKSLIAAAFVVLAANSAQAHQMVCHSLDKSKDVTVIMNSIDKSLEYPTDGGKYVYQIEVFEDDQCEASYDEVGLAETYDVMFNFKTKYKDITLDVFLDEMDQGTLTIDGEYSIDLECFHAENIPDQNPWK